MNTSPRPTNASPLVSSPSGIAPQALFLPLDQQSDHITWVNIPAAARLTLRAAQEQYSLPPEAMTYFLLHYQSAKVIHASPALFLVIFVAVPSARYLFTMQALKICVTPTVITTMYGPSGKVQSNLAQCLPFLSNLSAGRAGQFVCGLLEGVVGSYEAVVQVLEEPRLHAEAVRRGQQRRCRQVEKFIRCLHEAQVFLGTVMCEGRKLFVGEERKQLRRLEERVGVLARVAREMLHREQRA